MVTYFGTMHNRGMPHRAMLCLTFAAKSLMASDPWCVPVLWMCLIVGCMAQVSGAQVADQEDHPESHLNWKLPTLGGKQLWTDFAWRNGWRVQQNVLTQHWRLLVEYNFRHSWGSRQACEAELRLRQPEQAFPTGRATLLLHGLGRSSASMKGLASYLTAQGLGPTICVDYASSRDSITQHALALRDIISGLPEDLRIDFVGHSMGNIVVRHAISDWLQAGESQILKRVEHVVMLGPPNQGASIARQLSKTGVFGWVAGQGALELGRNWSELESHLATPPCPFGIIAGRVSRSSLNPLVDGEGDCVVSVEETRLPGESDFLELPVMHTFMIDDPAVQQAVAHFLFNSKFR